MREKLLQPRVIYGEQLKCAAVKDKELQLARQEGTASSKCITRLLNDTQNSTIASSLEQNRDRTLSGSFFALLLFKSPGQRIHRRPNTLISTFGL